MITVDLPAMGLKLQGVCYRVTKYQKITANHPFAGWRMQLYIVIIGTRILVMRLK